MNMFLTVMYSHEQNFKDIKNRKKNTFYTILSINISYNICIYNS